MADMRYRSVTDFIKGFKNKEFERSNSKEYQISLGWYDWFCKDQSLYNKSIALAKKFIQISDSKLFDNDKTYILFKNNCPMVGNLFDDFRICDIETNDVLYTVTPKIGYSSIVKSYKEGRLKGLSAVWGKDNNFKEVLIQGSWKDIKNFFLGK